MLLFNFYIKEKAPSVITQSLQQMLPPPPKIPQQQQITKLSPFVLFFYPGFVLHAWKLYHYHKLHMELFADVKNMLKIDSELVINSYQFIILSIVIKITRDCWHVFIRTIK